MGIKMKRVICRKCGVAHECAGVLSEGERARKAALARHGKARGAGRIDSKPLSGSGVDVGMVTAGNVAERAVSVAAKRVSGGCPAGDCPGVRNCRRAILTCEILRGEK